MLSISLLWVTVLVASCSCQTKNHYGTQDYEMSSWKVSNPPPVTAPPIYHPYYYNQPTTPPTTTTTTTPRPPPPPLPKNNVQYGNYYSPPAQLYYPASPPPPAPVSFPAPVPVSIPVRVSFGDNSPYTKPPYPQQQQQQQQQRSPRAPIIPIIKFDQEIKEGEFNRFHFISANGIEEEQETIIQKYPDSSASSGYGYNSNHNYEHPGCLLVKRGKFSYYSPEGQRVEMQWIADSNGFRPQGSHIPTSPPVPSQTRQLNYY